MICSLVEPDFFKISSCSAKERLDSAVLNFSSADETLLMAALVFVRAVEISDFQLSMVDWVSPVLGVRLLTAKAAFSRKVFISLRFFLDKSILEGKLLVMAN